MYCNFMSVRTVLLSVAFACMPAMLPAQVATLQITRTPQGTAVPSDYIGISIENTVGPTYFGTPAAPNYVFLQLLRNLGSAGSLRIGGNTGDSSCWAGETAPDPAICSSYSLTSNDFTSWALASAETGWPMLIGVSLAQAESPGATQYILDEITEGIMPVLAQHPKASLLGIELGNEINLYSRNPVYRPSTYSLTNQITDLSSYVTALKGNTMTHAIPLALPAYYDPTTTSITSQVDVIVKNLTKCLQCYPKGVGLVTLHEYPLTIYNGQMPTIAQLLSNSIDTNTEQVFGQAVTDMMADSLKVQLDENGSVSVDPGQPGVSNVQASVLWELDFALDMAKLGVRRANFHIHDGSYYVPIQVNSSGPGIYQVQVMPTYYSLYGFGLAKGQQFLPVSINTTANIRAYGLSTCSTCAITVYLINKDLSAFGPVQISLSAPATSASYFEIAAPSLSSPVQNITYGGVQFSNATGKITGPVQTQTIQPDVNGNYTVTLDNAAAGILTIQP